MTMFESKRSRILGAGGLAVAALVTLSATSCAEVEILCGSAHDGYSFEFILESGDGPCAQLIGDEVGLDTFISYPDNEPDFSQPDLSMKPLALALAVAEAESRSGEAITSPLYSIGQHATEYPDGGDFCSVPQLTTTAVSLPALEAVPDDPETEEDESLPAVEARDISYEWSDVRLYTTFTAQATQVIASLRYTENGCTATYTARGLFPYVPCSSDEDCNDPASSINPDFSTRCSAELGACILAGDPPSLK